MSRLHSSNDVFQKFAGIRVGSQFFGKSGRDACYRLLHSFAGSRKDGIFCDLFKRDFILNRRILIDYARKQLAYSVDIYGYVLDAVYYLSA